MLESVVGNRDGRGQGGGADAARRIDTEDRLRDQSVQLLDQAQESGRRPAKSVRILQLREPFLAGGAVYQTRNSGVNKQVAPEIFLKSKPYEWSMHRVGLYAWNKVCHDCPSVSAPGPKKRALTPLALPIGFSG